MLWWQIQYHPVLWRLPNVIDVVRERVFDISFGAREHALVILASLANSRETAKRIALAPDLVDSVLHLMRSERERLRLKQKALDLIGNLAQWGDADVYEVLLHHPTAATIEPFLKIIGYPRIRATMITVLLHTHRARDRGLGHVPQIDAQIVVEIIELFQKILDTGHAYDLVWALSEPLYPLLKLSTGPDPPVYDPWKLTESQRAEMLQNQCLRIIATPRVVEQAALVLTKSTDPWTLDLALGILIQVSSFHQLEHASPNHQADPLTCPLCAEPGAQPPQFVMLQRFVKLPDEAFKNALQWVKREHRGRHPSVFWKARNLLLRATSQKLEWEAFCLGTHKRLNSDSPLALLPADLMPRVLDFL
eukprot:c11580_g1_i2.p1 GENE.c11580_g1_i2~~c11580_g1_i2.p1  ORF type:complete len:363 (+),score=62.98 c11580_g1_i2:457-1545(+)